MGRTEDRNSSTSELHKGMYTDRSYLTATPQSPRIPAQAEDIDQYNRIHDMFHIMTNRHNRDLDDVTGFEMRWDEEGMEDAL